MKRCVVGFDTSNYTTSVALFDGGNGRNVGRLLEVPQEGLGLRQSDALFQHIKRLNFTIIGVIFITAGAKADKTDDSTTVFCHCIIPFCSRYIFYQPFGMGRHGRNTFFKHFIRQQTRISSKPGIC